MNQGPLTTFERDVWQAVKAISEIGLSKIGNEIEAATDLSQADFAVLYRLADTKKGKPSQSELQGSLGWDKSRLSHHLKRMEARQLVKREKSKTGRNLTSAQRSSFHFRSTSGPC
jgi:DNA-binding MarR family transcriptional regulator